MTRLDRIRNDIEVQRLREQHDDLIWEGRYLEAKHFCVQTLIPAERKIP